MNVLTKLGFATLAFVLAANADTPGKPSSDAESAINPFSAPATGWSAWAYILPARDRVLSFVSTKDFHDTQLNTAGKLAHG
jgi:hypothetical protein